MKKELFSAQGLSIEINKEYIYRDLNIIIYENELLGICQLSHLKKMSWMKQLLNPNTKVAGELFFEGKKIEGKAPKRNLKMYYISEGSALMESLSITDNLLAARNFQKGRILYNEKKEEETIQNILEELQLPIQVNTPVSSLSKSEGHLLQIIKAILLGAKLIILDNITDDYNIREFERLIDVINRYKNGGRTFVFFSNQENRLTKEADRLYILRKRRLAGQIYHDEYSSAVFFDMLHGEKIMPLLSRKSTIGQEEVFSSDFSGIINKTFRFMIHTGEIIGILDLYGSYTNAIVNCFMEGFPYKIKGKTCRNYQQAVKNGLAIISLSESDQIFPDFSIMENLTFQILPKISRGPVINRRIQKYCGEKYLKEIITEDQDGKQVTFSRIRLLLYKWFLARPKLFVLDSLTAGMDNNDQRKYRQIIDQAASEGTACIILTSISEECLNICDKIWVIRDESNCKMFDMNHELKDKDKMEDFRAYLKSPIS